MTFNKIIGWIAIFSGILAEILIWLQFFGVIDIAALVISMLPYIWVSFVAGLVIWIGNTIIKN